MKYIATITPTGAPFGTGRTMEIEIEEGGLVRVGEQTFQTDRRGSAIWTCTRCCWTTAPTRCMWTRRSAAPTG